MGRVGPRGGWGLCGIPARTLGAPAFVPPVTPRHGFGGGFGGPMDFIELVVDHDDDLDGLLEWIVEAMADD